MDELMDKNLPYFVGGNLATLEDGRQRLVYNGTSDMRKIEVYRVTVRPSVCLSHGSTTTAGLLLSAGVCRRLVLVLLCS